MRGDTRSLIHGIINLIVPAFAGVVVNNFKYAIFIRVFDMADTAKTFEIPDKL